MSGEPENCQEEQEIIIDDEPQQPTIVNQHSQVEYYECDDDYQCFDSDLMSKNS